MPEKRFDYSWFVHKPDELSTEFVSWARSLSAGGGVPFGIKALDDVILPLTPGREVVMIARPGHGKTTFLIWLAIREARRIIERKSNEVVVFVTYEQTAEELTAMIQAAMGQYSVGDLVRGRVDLDRVVIPNALQQVALPIWIIGHGLSRVDPKAPRMTPETVYEALEAMKAEYGVKVSLICFDYLQLIPIGKATDRVQQVTEAPIRIKELAMRIGCPAVLAVQAARDVDNRDIKLPRLADAQWASSIEQTADLALGMWRPALTEQDGQLLQITKTMCVPVTPNLFVLRMLKQRFAPGQHTWLLHFDMALLNVFEMEMKNGSIAYR